MDQLLARVPAERIAVSVRDPEGAKELAERGVRVRRGDFDDPETLAGAFEGADQILLVSAASTGDTALRQHRAAIAAARDSGARRVLYTSHMGANPASPFAPMPDHGETEGVAGGGCAVHVAAERVLRGYDRDASWLGAADRGVGRA